MSLDRPNIVMFHCDDIGQHLGCYGAGVRTPNIDQLAHEGVRFENAFCTAPQCSPSRGSLLTGRYPHNNGLMGLTNVGGWSLNADERALPQYLAEVGYHTVRYGQQHVGDDERLGFESVHKAIEFSEGGSEGFPWWPALGVAETFEETFADELTGNQPFYAHIGTSEPHQPYRHQWVLEAAYDEYDAEDVAIPDFLPDTKGVRQDIAELNACISGTVDPAVGQIRQTLLDRDVLDDTLFIFIADHGIDMPRGKGMCYRPGIEIPLVMRHPDLPSGVHNDLVSNVDVLPTLIDLLGIDVRPPHPLDGQSFAGLFGDFKYEPRSKIFAEITWHGQYNPIRSVRTTEYAYHRTFTNTPLVYMPYWESRAAKELALEYYGTRRPMEQLYDLNVDPLERENLAPSNTYADGEGDVESAACPDVLADMRETLYDRLTADGDPILNGPVALPQRIGW